MAAALSDAHRRFLQALLARGVVEAAEAERLRRLCCQRHPGQWGRPLSGGAARGSPQKAGAAGRTLGGPGGVRRGGWWGDGRLTLPPPLCLPAAPGASDHLDDFLAALNAQLQPLSMEIRKGSAEDSGGTYVALVSGGRGGVLGVPWLGALCPGAARAEPPPAPFLPR